MRNLRRVSVVATLSLFVFSVALSGALSGTARAQNAPPPFDPAIDVQTFGYAVGPKTFFTVADADVVAERQLALDALVTYLTKPFMVYHYDTMTGGLGDERTVVVKSLAALQLTAAYGVTERFQLGANLPVIITLNGDGPMPDTGGPSCATPPCLNVSGLGDLVVEGKYRLYRRGTLRLGGIAALSLPTSIGSDGAKFIGDDLPSFGTRLALQYDLAPRLAVGVNAGILLRKPRTIYDSTIGQQLTWGVGIAARIASRVSLVGESYGRAGLPDFSLDASPLEVEAGLRLYATSAVAVVVGGGTGLIRGIGSPQARMFVSLGYAPDTRDNDGDGVANGRDRCPLVPEDRDGFGDGDGCPDDDNDGDHRSDATDRCPTQPEDLDGFDDDDGCPELDNDKDGIADLEDKCPADAEDGKAPHAKDGCPGDKRDSDGDGVTDAADACALEEEDLDGFDDGDGCPDLDNDKDGVADAADRCPLCAEDTDRFDDTDGCPDLDNDKDGIADTADRCPLEPETLNGTTDTDGCPDAGAAIVELDGDLLRITKMPALAGAALTAPSAKLVDQMAIVMRGHDEVTRWLIALALPDATAAKRLAEAIRARLATRGIPADRIELLTGPGTPKIGGVVKERADPGAAPTCPGARPPAPATPAPAAPTSPAQPTPTKPPTQQQPEEPEIEIEIDGE